MQDIIKQWPILSLLPMCTTDAGLTYKRETIPSPAAGGYCRTSLLAYIVSF